LPGTDIREIAVPDLIGIFGHTHSERLTNMSEFVLKEAEIDGSGMFGKKSEINTRAVPSCAKRIGVSRPNTWAL